MREFLSVVIIPFILTCAICFYSVFDHFYTESPLENTVHYTLRLGHGTHTSIPENSKIVQAAIDDIEKELNIKIEIVDNFVYEPVPFSGLVWSVLECKGQGEMYAKEKGSGHADLTVCLEDTVIGGVAAGVAVPGLGTMIAHVVQKHEGIQGGYSDEQIERMSLNTVKHELGHLFGCEHSRKGVMFWRTRKKDYERIGKFSNESIRQVKKYHNRKKSRKERNSVIVVDRCVNHEHTP